MDAKNEYSRLEVDVDNLEDPAAKEYIKAIIDVMQKSRDRKVPIICLTFDPSNKVALLGFQGLKQDFVLLMKEALKQNPFFPEVVGIAAMISKIEKDEDEQIVNYANRANSTGN